MGYPRGLPVYAFSGGSYTGYNATTDAAGQVQFTLPLGDIASGPTQRDPVLERDDHHCCCPGAKRPTSS